MAERKTKKKPEEASPALVLVTHVWRNSQQATGHSWTRLNAAMTLAVELAIRAGLRFGPNDMAEISRTMRGGYWFRGENLYTVAVKYVNTTACVSYETMVNRPAFVFGGGRLAEGSDLKWGDAGAVRVTSFAADGKSLIACSYLGSARKPARRVTITIEEMRAAEKTRTTANKELRAISTLQNGLTMSGLPVAAATASAWTKEQREQVSTWLTTFSPNQAPAFVIAASRVEQARMKRLSELSATAGGKR